MLAKPRAEGTRALQNGGVAIQLRCPPGPHPPVGLQDTAALPPTCQGTSPRLSASSPSYSSCSNCCHHFMTGRRWGGLEGSPHAPQMQYCSSGQGGGCLPLTQVLGMGPGCGLGSVARQRPLARAVTLQGALRNPPPPPAWPLRPVSRRLRFWLTAPALRGAAKGGSGVSMMFPVMLLLWGPWVGFGVVDLAFLSLDVPGNAEPVRLTILSLPWAPFSCLAWVWGLGLLRSLPSW